MSGYTKLFASIIGSTIWREDPATKVTWITMLALADYDGIVEASIPGLADLARVSVGEVQSALAKFMAPDEFSRTPDYDGRRIEPVDGGWLLLNHARYREKMSPEYRKERARLRQQRHRAKDETEHALAVTQKRDTSVTECDASLLSRHTHTDSDSEEKENTHTPQTTGAANRVCVQISLSGLKNQTAIQGIIESEIARTSQPPEAIAEQMISAWEDYRATPGKSFEYGRTLSFFESGIWLRPESWTKAGTKTRTKKLRDPDTGEVYIVPADGQREKPLSERLREMGQL